MANITPGTSEWLDQVVEAFAAAADKSAGAIKVQVMPGA